MIASKPENRPSATQILQHHAFWTESFSMQAFIDVSNCLESAAGGKTTAFCVEELEKCKLVNLYTMHAETRQHNGWILFLCPLLQAHIQRKINKRTVPYDGLKISHLLRFIRNLYNHFSSQPAEIQQVLGPLPGGFLKYWLDRYPFLIEALYQSFRPAAKVFNHVLQKYYPENSTPSLHVDQIDLLAKYAKSRAVKYLVFQYRDYE